MGTERFWTILLLLVCSLSDILCQTAWDAKNLTRHLFQTETYNKRIRPIINQTDQINVSIDFHLIAVNSIDAVTETLRTTGYLSITWQDEFLVWKPADYGGLTYYHWPQNDIWKPDVTLKNSNYDYKQLGDESLKVKVEHTGLVLWEPFQVFESKCSLDITYFPFDSQQCSLKFDSWSYSINEVYMQGGQHGLVISEYEKNPEWNLVDTDQYTVKEAREATLVFDVFLQRKPLYDSVTLIFPITMLTVLDLFVFILPAECGEKASYAVTIFLAIVVFFTLVEASFPSSSATFAYFAIYLIIQTVQSTLVTLAALGIVRCGLNDDRMRIPKCLQLLVRLCKYSQNSISCNTNGMKENMLVNSVNTNESELGDHANIPKEPANELADTWKDVANALDKVCFVFFLCMFIVSSLLFLIVSL